MSLSVLTVGVLCRYRLVAPPALSMDPDTCVFTCEAVAQVLVEIHASVESATKRGKVVGAPRPKHIIDLLDLLAVLLGRTFRGAASKAELYAAAIAQLHTLRDTQATFGASRDSMVQALHYAKARVAKAQSVLKPLQEEKASAEKQLRAARSELAQVGGEIEDCHGRTPPAQEGAGEWLAKLHSSRDALVKSLSRLRKATCGSKSVAPGHKAAVVALFQIRCECMFGEGRKPPHVTSGLRVPRSHRGRTWSPSSTTQNM